MKTLQFILPSKAVTSALPRQEESRDSEESSASHRHSQVLVAQWATEFLSHLIQPQGPWSPFMMLLKPMSNHLLPWITTVVVLLPSFHKFSEKHTA